MSKAYRRRARPSYPRLCPNTARTRKTLTAISIFSLTLFFGGGCAETNATDPIGPQIEPSFLQGGSGPAEYSITALPSPPGADECWANDISNSGTAVGACTTWGGAGDEDLVRGIVWMPGAFHVLPSLGGFETVAGDINDRGWIVGASRAPDGMTHAVLWRDFETVEDLGNPDALRSTAHGINDRGQVSLTSCTTLFDCRGFLWDDGALIDVGDLGGGTTVAAAINAVGQVVGYSYRSDGTYHAFVWQDGVMRDLGTLGGDYSIALGLNDRGQVVGESRISTFETHAFLWDNSEMTELNVPGASFARAHDINPAGVVVGIVAFPGLGIRAAVWQAGVPTVLGGIGSGISVAQAANARGLIAGQSLDDVGDPTGNRAVIWKR